MIITLAIIIAVLLIALACALEALSYIQHELDAALAALQDARDEIADDNVIIGWQRRQISGHIQDNSLLLREVYCLREAGSEALDAEELVSEVDAWLAEEAAT